MYSVRDSQGKPYARALMTVTALACLLAGCSDGVSQVSPVPERSAPATPRRKTLGALNPQTARFKTWVTNDDDSVSETPRCLVTVHDPSGRYNGFRTFTLKPIASGDRALLLRNVPISHQGAKFVTDWDITCR